MGRFWERTQNIKGVQKGVTFFLRQRRGHGPLPPSPCIHPWFGEVIPSPAGFYADACTDMSVIAKRRKRQDKRRSHRLSDRYRVKSGVPAALNVKWLDGTENWKLIIILTPATLIDDENLINDDYRIWIANWLKMGSKINLKGGNSPFPP